MKLAGAVIVVAVCTIFGIAKAAALCTRARCLAQTVAALRYISSELSTCAQTLPVIVSQLGVSGGREIAPAFHKLSDSMSRLSEESFDDLWCETCMDKSLNLSDVQKQELSRLGAYLGRYPVQEQCAAIAACIAHLEPEFERACVAARQGKKMWTGVGLAMGLMLAAVFI